MCASDMNALEALDAMRNGDTLTTKDRIGWFNMSGNNCINFSCPGDYPCCHDDYSISDFLEMFSDSEFTKD